MLNKNGLINEYPFIPISLGFRLVFIIYFFIFIFLQNLLIVFLQNDISLIIHFLDIIYFSLIFIPIFFYRKNYGWLHPLIFPALFSLAKSIASDPVAMFNLFFINQNETSFQISHVLLNDISDTEIRYIHIKGQLMNILALLSYYFGFFFFSGIGMMKLTYTLPKSNFKTKLFLIYTLSIIIFIIYVQFRGGINAHILSWSSGRFNALAGDGPVFVAVKVAALAALIWFTFDFKGARTSPIFWFMVITSIPIQFLLTGSRSDGVYMSIWFLLVNMIQSKRIPGLQIGVLGFLAAILISSLGLIRNSTYQGKVAWNKTINEFDIGQALSQTQEEFEKRKGEVNGYLPVMAMVPDQVDYLYGESYIGAVLFFVPRYFWPSKPRGAGAMVGELIFGRNSGAGVPPGPTGEAYWNFGIFGVIAIFLIFGRIHKTLEYYYLNNYKKKGYQLIYVITLFMLAPTSIKIVAYFQTIIPALVILWWIGALSIGKNKSLIDEHQ